LCSARNPIQAEFTGNKTYRLVSVAGSRFRLISISLPGRKAGFTTSEALSVKEESVRRCLRKILPSDCGILWKRRASKTRVEKERERESGSFVLLVCPPDRFLFGHRVRHFPDSIGGLKGLLNACRDWNIARSNVSPRRSNVFRLARCILGTTCANTGLLHAARVHMLGTILPGENVRARNLDLCAFGDGVILRKKPRFLSSRRGAMEGSEWTPQRSDNVIVH